MHQRHLAMVVDPVRADDSRSDRTGPCGLSRDPFLDRELRRIPAMLRPHLAEEGGSVRGGVSTCVGADLLVTTAAFLSSSPSCEAS